MNCFCLITFKSQYVLYDKDHLPACTKSGKLLSKGSILVAVKIYCPLFNSIKNIE